MASLPTPYLDTLLLQPQVSMQAVATGKQLFIKTKLSFSRLVCSLTLSSLLACTLLAFSELIKS